MHSYILIPSGPSPMDGQKVMAEVISVHFPLWFSFLSVTAQQETPVICTGMGFGSGTLLKDAKSKGLSTWAGVKLRDRALT